MPQYKRHLLLAFRDLTSGNATYGGGRFMDIEIPEGDSMLIDLNKAYNPYCAYSTRYACPITPDDNFLDIEVKAGVRMEWRGDSLVAFRNERKSTLYFLDGSVYELVRNVTVPDGNVMDSIGNVTVPDENVKVLNRNVKDFHENVKVWHGNVKDWLGNVKVWRENVKDSLENVKDLLENVKDSLGNVKDWRENVKDSLGNVTKRLGNVTFRLGNVTIRLGIVTIRLGNVTERIRKAEKQGRTGRPIVAKATIYSSVGTQVG